MQIGYRTDIGKSRLTNEDRLLARPPLLAVADGMGGAQAGEVASEMAIHVLWEAAPGGEPPQERLKQAILEANRRIFALANSDSRCAGMGTTLTAVLLENHMAYVGHVGDSRAYLVRGQHIRRLTQDQSVVGELMRLGYLSEAEAMVHPQRNILTQALGTEPHVQVELTQFPIEPGDRLVLCTDGLTSLVQDGEILDTLRQEREPQAAADRLVDLALDRGGYDNVTVVVAYIPPVSG
ncbi:MAG: Stp1/IreP family PP2C-type Ser/Thr phosphatase [Firmicutes bacterium]|nr:Stp1/IreP family PP2C-type Ser/Thr phosphatase [Bacillota bacterium]